LPSHTSQADTIRIYLETHTNEKITLYISNTMLLYTATEKTIIKTTKPTKEEIKCGSNSPNKKYL